jgi:tRNA-Thr(GGU) m(6)t(6)A37 methyltransferase TsaA
LVSASWARLRLRADLQPELALQGLENFSHLWLIWVFHQNQNKKYHAKIHPPRLRGETTGIFATRSPHRPNPIGLSVVKIEKIEHHGLILSGADLVDGTPILDIKPYLPEVECLPEAHGGWTTRTAGPAFEVEFTDVAQARLAQWEANEKKTSLRALIIETLLHDPRPEVYRTLDRPHAFRLFDGDVHFRYRDERTVEVFEILIPATQSSTILSTF